MGISREICNNLKERSQELYVVPYAHKWDTNVINAVNPLSFNRLSTYSGKGPKKGTISLQQNQRQEVAKVYVAAPAKGRGYAGILTCQEIIRYKNVYMLLVVGKSWALPGEDENQSKLNNMEGLISMLRLYPFGILA
ncbi:hypothetical protein Tco_0850201 [Tanacetum coccineum]